MKIISYIISVLLFITATSSQIIDQTDNIRYTSNQVNQLFYKIPSQMDNIFELDYAIPQFYVSVPVNTPVLFLGEETNTFGKWYKVKYNDKIYYSRPMNFSEVPCEEINYDIFYNHEYIEESIYVDGIIEKEYLNEIYNYLALLPTDILQSYEGTIYITTESVAVKTNQNNFNIKGSYQPSTSNIYIHKNYLKDVLHEFGHHYYYKFFKDNLGFKAIYNQESSTSGLSRYFTSSEGEYFAECFKLYLIQDERFIKHCPLTYEYFNKIIQK